MGEASGGPASICRRLGHPRRAEQVRLAQILPKPFDVPVMNQTFTDPIVAAPQLAWTCRGGQ
jgi:hypothetical protein